MLEGHFDLNAFEILCDLLGTNAARLLRHDLREASRCDEESYPYKRGLATYACLLALTRSESNTRELLIALTNLQSQYDNLFQAISRLEPIILNQQKSWFASFWFQTTATASLEKPILRFGGAVAWLKLLLHRNRRELVCIGIGTLMLCLILCSIGYFFALRETHRLHTWQTEQKNINEKLRIEYRAEAERMINGQVDARVRAEQKATEETLHAKYNAESEKMVSEQVASRLQAMSPVTYKLAQALEGRAHRVLLSGYGTTWEVKITKNDGLVYSTTGDLITDKLLYFKDEPDRLPLAQTAPLSRTTVPTDEKRSHR